MTDDIVKRLREVCTDWNGAPMQRNEPPRGASDGPHCAIFYDAADEIERLRAQVAKLRGLLWYGWHEMNAIRARSGVPLDERGSKQSISEEYWDAVVEAMNEALGDDAKPWPSDDANAALKETEQ